MTLVLFAHAFVSFVVVLFLMEVTRRVAIRVGFCSKPVADRWNPRSVPLGGGVAVVLVLLVGLAFVDAKAFLDLGPVLLGLCLFGLADDILNFMPSRKLLFQGIVASYLVYRGYSFVPGSGWFNDVLSVLWIVFLTNALNLNDNMDGLCGGIAVVGVSALVLVAFDSAPASHVLFGLMIIGAIFGFLFHNLMPARIFLGDTGSLPLGCILSIYSFEVTGRGDVALPVSLLQILLALCVPLFDVAFVISRRYFNGRSLLRGNTDHVSHRLVRAGLKEVTTVTMLHFIGVIGAFAAVLIPSRQPGVIPFIAAGVMLIPFGFLTALLLRSEKTGYKLSLPVAEIAAKKLVSSIVMLRPIFK